MRKLLETKVFGMEKVKTVRYKWCTNDTVYQAYHDRDWGIPKFDDQTLFEMLILEGAQAGLSWITILKRRENYRKAFNDFDVNAVASYSDKDVKRLLQDTGIIRNGLKIKSAINNAKIFVEIQSEYGTFSKYLWNFVNHTPVINEFSLHEDVPVTTEQAQLISKDLKKRGMSFVGPIIIYSYMQSVGMVNDHTLDCYLRRTDHGFIS